MVLLNTALCLPAIETETLIQGVSVVAAPKRFIVPGKRFALLPVQALPEDLAKEQIYHSSTVSKFAKASLDKETLSIKAWGKCELCQHFTSQEKVQALSHYTIWKIDALAEHLRNQENLFLAFIRAYWLSEPISYDTLFTYESPEQLNNLTPLAQYLDVNESQPVLAEDNFLNLKQQLVDLKVDFSVASPDGLETDIADEPETDAAKISLSLEIIDDPEWFLKIAEVGNSSDGHTFEKLVRKSLQALGFQNSKQNIKASLDPLATGGAGGLDFYANIPYPVVGECKATKTEKVSTGAPAQLMRLGHNILQNHYDECIKLLVAAGDLTSAALKTAENNDIGIIRPETLQKLIELKVAYPGSIDLMEMGTILRKEPFGEKTDQRINDYVSSVWRSLTVRSLLVEAVRQLSIQEKNQPVTARDVRVYYNAVFAKAPIDPLRNINIVRDLLIELSSPLTAYVGRQNVEDGTERFYFLQTLKIED
ncbi:MAG: DUF1802 family protein [Phormidesmis sp.]